MSLINRVKRLKKTIRQVGLKPAVLFGIYKLGIKTGYYKIITPTHKIFFPSKIPANTVDVIRDFGKKGWNIPPKQYLLDHYKDNLPGLVDEADRIINGEIHLFGGDLVPLQLEPEPPLNHWSKISDENSDQDIKFFWEPARFGLAFTLGRAYLYTGNEKYPEAFWELVEKFLEANPVNLGPNWASSQEIALRIIAFSFALQVFQFSRHSTLERQVRLLKSVKDHADRIPPTLIYAQAQNNNHLLSEAAGLYTAGILLSHLPKSKKWKKLGWEIINQAICNQVMADGTYIQQSMNYHRLMLHLVLWIKTLGEKHGDVLWDETQKKMAAAARWLLSQVDPISGGVQNLGHNDGALLFPLSTADFSDYRPIAQAVSIAVLEGPLLPHGIWDELSDWLGISTDIIYPKNQVEITSPGVLKLKAVNSWATIRAATYTARPAHADQLHLDLWWQGHNIALDPGTYRYTAPRPWDNSLVRTIVHNSVVVENSDQMERAGRFLWLDWSSAKRVPEFENDFTIVAEHDGYKKFDCIHRRLITYHDSDHWEVRDYLLPVIPSERSYQGVINWLLPDGIWKIEEQAISLQLPFGLIKLKISNSLSDQFQANNNQQVEIDSRNQNGMGIEGNIRLIRAGKLLVGAPDNDDEILGWFSPTYGKKIPALSFQYNIKGSLPIHITSFWELSINSR